MNQYLILIDIGGSYIKVASHQRSSKKIERFDKLNYPNFVELQPLKRENDPFEIIQILNNQLNKINMQDRQIVGIYLSGQMGCWLITNENNIPITNIFSWQDESILIQKDNYNQILLEIDNEIEPSWVFNSGNELRPSLPVISLFNKIKTKEIKIQKGYRFHTLLTWIQSQITENYHFTAHPTDIAASGALNIYTNSYHLPDSWKKIINMPSINSDIIKVGKLKNTEIPVFSAIGDQQASLLGSNLDPESIVVNIGTGGQVAKILNFSEEKNYQIRPFFNDTKIKTKTHLPSGITINKFLSKLKNTKSDLEKYDWLTNHSIKNLNISIDLNNQLNFDYSGSILTKYGIEELTQQFLYSLINQYLLIVKSFDTPKIKQIIFAGGVGQKFFNFHRFFENNSNKHILVSDTLETTLTGLNLIASHYKNE